MSRWTVVLAALFALPAAAQDAPPAEAPAASSGPVQYSVHSGGSALLLRTYKEGVGAALAHDHAIRATKTSGTVSFDPAAPAGCAISVSVDVASLRVDEAADRSALGLTGEISEGDRATIREHMLAADQLAVAKHPTMSFTSSSCADGKLSGKLTIRGVSKDVSFPATYTADAAGFRVVGAVELKHADFGFQPYSAMMGAIRNGERLTLKVDLRAKPAG